MRFYYFGYICLLLILSSVVMPSDVYDNDDEEDEDHERPGHMDSSFKHKHYDDAGEHDDDYDHEAVTGTHDDFDDLSPEEAKEKLGKLVVKMDLNKDGKVDRTELIAWIINSFKKLDIVDGHEAFEDVDTNKDKKLSLEEYLEITYKKKEADIVTLAKAADKKSKDMAKSMLNDMNRFKLADVNKDGFLSADEFIAFHHPHNYNHMAPQEVATALQDYDTNKDGKLTLAEFLGVDKLDNNTKAEETAHFKKLDTNGDGILDEKEITKWVVPGMEIPAAEEADHLIKETDANKDSTLTNEEIQNKHELWVGSQATDYGKHISDEL